MARLRRICGDAADSDEIPLTDAGRLQAHKLALRLVREFCPEVLVSGTFLRGRQTSEIIGRVLSLEAETIQGIQERDFGCLKGHPYKRLGESMSRDGLATRLRWCGHGGRRAVKASKTCDAVRSRRLRPCAIATPGGRSSS